VLIFYRILLFLVLGAAGIYFIVRSEPMVRMFGHNDLAERYLGSGGSYTFWKLLGILFIILGALFLVGTLNFAFGS
jgi:hypothetical protein